MKKLLTILLSVLFVLTVFSVSACGPVKQISVTFDGNGGLTADGQTAVVMTVNANAPFSAPTFVKAGYKFKGWDTDLNLLKDGDTVKATWAKIVTLTFVGNGGLTADGKDVVVIDNYVVGDPIVAPEFGKVGVEFTFWTFSLDNVNKLEEIYDDCTIIANYSETKELKVNFDVKGGTPACESIIVELGSEILASQLPVVNKYDDGDAVPDFELVGWYLNGVKLKVGDIWKADVHEITLVAVWSPLWSDYV